MGPSDYGRSGTALKYLSDNGGENFWGFERMRAMNQVRGVVLLLAGGVAIFEGFHALHGRQAAMAYLLGVVAFAVGIWRIAQKGR